MYKKLIAMALSAALVFCSAVPAFASGMTQGVLSEDPVMPYGTVIQADRSTDAEVPAETVTPAEPEDSAAAENSAGMEDAGSEDFAGETETPAEPETPEEDEETEAEKAERIAAEKYRNGLASYMRSKNTKMGKVWSRNLAQTFIDIGEKYDLDPKVLMALAQRESTFSSKATSPYGYKGMMQTSDWLAKHYGYKPSQLYEAEVSIDVAARYIRSLKKTFGTYTMALCGYIYGGYAVKKGNYSKKAAWKVMNTRSDIQDYLEKYDFV